MKLGEVSPCLARGVQIVGNPEDGPKLALEKDADQAVEPVSHRPERALLCPANH